MTLQPARLLSVIMTLPLAACAASSDPTPVNDEAPYASWSAQAMHEDGESLFLAVYTGLGDEALGVPALATPDSPAQVRATWQNVADLVSEGHDSFFKEFSMKMRSGDPYEVQAALNQGYELTSSVAPDLTRLDQAYHDEIEKCVVVNLAAAINVGAAVNIAAAVAVVAVVVNQKWVWEASPVEARRESEAFVRDLTGKLRKA